MQHVIITNISICQKSHTLYIKFFSLGITLTFDYPIRTASLRNLPSAVKCMLLFCAVLTLPSSAFTLKREKVEHWKTLETGEYTCSSQRELKGKTFLLAKKRKWTKMDLEKHSTISVLSSKVLWPLTLLCCKCAALILTLRNVSLH